MNQGIVIKSEHLRKSNAKCMIIVDYTILRHGAHNTTLSKVPQIYQIFI